MQLQGKPHPCKNLKNFRAKAIKGKAVVSYCEFMATAGATRDLES
jgi:hypothetical protein